MNFNLHTYPTGLVFVVKVGSFSFDKNIEEQSDFEEHLQLWEKIWCAIDATGILKIKEISQLPSPEFAMAAAKLDGITYLVFQALKAIPENSELFTQLLEIASKLESSRILIISAVYGYSPY